MTTFEKLRQEFSTNWATVFVGWKGLGVFSPWPDRRQDFPPLLSRSEVATYADEHLAIAEDRAELDVVERLSSAAWRGDTRECIESLLSRLAGQEPSGEGLELRKWRATLLEQVLATIPQDPIYGLLTLTEFWQEFGFPADSPHEIQEMGKSPDPSEYYQRENFDRLLSRHVEWLRTERMAINVQDSQLR